EPLPHECELALPALEPGLEPAKLALSFSGMAVRRLRRKLAAGREAAVLEPLPFGLQLDPPRCELLLDASRLLFPLLEPLALGRRELSLGLRLAALRLRDRELCGELSLPLADALGLRCELRLTPLQLPLPGVESLGAFERGALPRDDGLERDGVSLLLPARLRRLAGAEPALELCELAPARGDRLRALAPRLLQPPHLRVALPRRPPPLPRRARPAP